MAVRLWYSIWIDRERRYFVVEMATVIPPPNKRQKTALAERAREQQSINSIPDDLGSVRVQFFDQSTGKATGGSVSIPVADATVKNLELLVNSLLGNVCTSLSSYVSSLHIVFWLFPVFSNYQVVISYCTYLSLSLSIKFTFTPESHTLQKCKSPKII